MATATKLLPRAAALSEFVAGYHGDCGQTAELAALHVRDGTPLDAPHLAAIVKRDIQHGWASASGSETTHAIADDLALLGVPHTLYDYPGPANWRDLLRTCAGVKPVIVFITNGQALPGDERGLHGHFICVLGVSPRGYLCCDGDNPISRLGKLATYTEQQLAAAQPHGLVVVEMEDAVGIPAGWKDDGRTLTAPNGQPVVRGFREYILTHPWEPGNWPLAPERAVTTGSVEPGNPAIGPGARQDFRECSLGWTQSRGAYVIWLNATDIPYYLHEIADLRAKLASLRAASDALTGALAALQGV